MTTQDGRAGIDTSIAAPTWAERASAQRREQALLLLIPRLVVLAAGPVLARLVFSSVHSRGDMNTAGDLVGSMLSLGLGLIGAATTLVIVWVVGWLMLRRI